MTIHITLSSVFVDDQEKALRFYTEVLGFVTKQDVSAGDYRWLTVGTADSPFSTELLLEPNAHPAAKQYQQAIYADGIPATSFMVDDLQAEYERLKGLGVEFRGEPISADWGAYAVFDDTCGNLINLHQILGQSEGEGQD